MHICLVRCPAPFLIDDRLLPPLGLMAVATALRQAGHEVLIHDGDLHETPLDFPAYGFGPTTPEYPAALETKNRIKAVNASAKVVIGGPHATLSPQMCLDAGFDAVVVGDGEIAAVEAFRNGGRLFTPAELPLDLYPTIDRTVLDLSRYKYTLQGRRATTMMTGQGCPFKCGFCAKNYKTVRFRSIGRVAEEIEILHVQFGYRALAFPEDIWILDRGRAEALCGHLKSRGIIWRCLVRGDLIVKYGPGFLQTLGDSGCISLSIGIESGSDKILKIIRKGETAATLLQAVRMVKAAGIPIKGFMIVGLPGETRETLAETQAFLDAAQLDDVDFKMFQPFPGSPIWEHPERYDVTWREDQPLDTRFYKGRLGEYYGTIQTSALTTEEIYRAWVDLESTYRK